MTQCDFESNMWLSMRLTVPYCASGMGLTMRPVHRHSAYKYFWFCRPNWADIIRLPPSLLWLQSNADRIRPVTKWSQWFPHIYRYIRCHRRTISPILKSTPKREKKNDNQNTIRALHSENQNKKKKQQNKVTSPLYAIQNLPDFNVNSEVFRFHQRLFSFLTKM